MAKGRTGFLLEGWKFGVYIMVPIVASVYFGSPARQKEAADYWGYVKYPANPNTNMKEKIEELQKQKEQRLKYREQLMELNAQANKTVKNTEAAASPRRGWLRRIGLGRNEESS